MVTFPKTTAEISRELLAFPQGSRAHCFEDSLIVTDPAGHEIGIVDCSESDPTPPSSDTEPSF